MIDEPSPSRTGLALTGLATLVGAATTLLSGVWIGVVGVILGVAGVARCSRRLLGVGVLALFVGVAAAGVLGVSSLLLVPAMAGTVLSWDVGENAITVAEQFPAEAETARGETLHATVSAIVVALFAAGALAVQTVSVGEYPLVAVVLVVFGALVVLVGLGR